MLPNEFKNKFKHLLGPQEAERLFTALTKGQAKHAFRLNSLKANQIDCSAYQAVPGISSAYYGKINDRDPLWISGQIYSQDPAAMYPAIIANAQPGERVLDLCAAPGGKTTALAAAMKDQGVLVANEISRQRAQILKENLERWGNSNSLVTNASPEQLAAKFKHFFDLILVDAPCSGEGMFRKNEASQYWSQDYVLSCQNRQKKILQSAVKMLKQGGRLVYSTCTFSPEENEDIVNWLSSCCKLQILSLDKFVSSKISPGHPDWSSTNNPKLRGTLHFWPQNNLGEGQYCALLCNTNDVEDSNDQHFKKKKRHQAAATHLNKAQQNLLADFLANFDLPAALQNWQQRLCVSNDHVFLPVLAPEQVQGLHILNNGLELGELRKKRFIPSQQLAQFLAQILQSQLYELPNHEDFTKYLHGEAVPTQSRQHGWILVAYQGLIFSWGRLANRQLLKNFYPKGLRK
jgi:NOL1/NOP2/sun family putative RNA methylase